MNKVMLIGRLGAPPELRYTPSGGAVVTVSLATSEYSKDKQTGERKQSTEWHRVVFWNRLAEVVNEFAVKGSQILVVGRLRTRSWDDHGTTRYMTEVMAQELELLGSRTGSAGDKPTNTAPPSDAVATDNFAGWDDDIPF